MGYRVVSPGRVNNAGKVNNATCFDSKSCPKISICKYLIRIAKYFGCSQECFVMAMVYLDRVVTLNPNFAISTLNIHKLVLSSVVIATKYFEDSFNSNKHFAMIGGVHLSELNNLELSFLQLIQWKLHVLPHDYSFC